jgi:hypothetical protein
MITGLPVNVAFAPNVKTVDSIALYKNIKIRK